MQSQKFQILLLAAKTEMFSLVFLLSEINGKRLCKSNVEEKGRFVHIRSIAQDQQAWRKFSNVVCKVREVTRNIHVITA